MDWVQAKVTQIMVCVYHFIATYPRLAILLKILWRIFKIPLQSVGKIWWDFGLVSIYICNTIKSPDRLTGQKEVFSAIWHYALVPESFIILSNFLVATVSHLQQDNGESGGGLLNSLFESRGTMFVIFSYINASVDHLSRGKIRVDPAQIAIVWLSKVQVMYNIPVWLSEIVATYNIPQLIITSGLGLLFYSFFKKHRFRIKCVLFSFLILACLDILLRWTFLKLGLHHTLTLPYGTICFSTTQFSLVPFEWGVLYYIISRCFN